MGDAARDRVAAVRAGWALIDGRLEADVLLRIGGDGRLAEVTPGGGASDPAALDWSHRMVVPGTCNVHSHSFQVLLRGRCEAVASFQDWVSSRLYPMVEALDIDAVRAASRLAFTEMLLNGVTLVGEFHYVHRGPGGADVANAYSEAILDSAREVGLRICLLRAFYDRGGRPGRERFVESPAVAQERVEALRRATCGDELVTVGAAPHSLHGASPEAFMAAHEWAVRSDAPLHVHLAEQRADLDEARSLPGGRPLRALEALGVLDARLVVVHGCWLDGDEIAELGRARSGLAYNPSSNMALGDGITDIPAMRRSGVRVSLGTDGACANNQFDVFREMRTTEHLQRVRALRMGVLTPGRGARDLVEMGTVNGYRNLGLRGGVLEPGALADLLALDPHDPSLQPLPSGMSPAEAGELLLAQLAFSLSVRGALTDVLVGGRPAVAGRRSVGVDVAAAAGAVRDLSLWERLR